MIPSKALTASLERTALRDPSTLFFSYVFPSALLVILAQTMGSSPGVRGHSVVDSIGPNVVGIGVTFVGLFAGGMNIAEWRENKMLGVLRCVPLSVSRILMSAFTVALVSAFVQAVLIIVRDYALGWDVLVTVGLARSCAGIPGGPGVLPYRYSCRTRGPQSPGRAARHYAHCLPHVLRLGRHDASGDAAELGGDTLALPAHDLRPERPALAADRCRRPE